MKTILVCALVALLNAPLLAEPILSAGSARWQPEVRVVAAELLARGAGQLSARQTWHPYISLRLPVGGPWLDLSYQHYAARAGSGDFSFDLHACGLTPAIALSPFNVQVQLGVGPELLYLSQRGRAARSDMTYEKGQTAIGWLSVVGLSWEFRRRLGVEARLLHRGASDLRIDQLPIDLSGWTLNLGVSLYLRP